MNVLSKPKILIVDDEQINLDFFQVMLSRLGFDIFTADNGEDGLDLIREIDPDLLILDIMMPGINGWQIVELLKNDPEYAPFKDLPVIMFTAMNEAEERVRGFELGIDDYITKPFVFSEAFARIRAVLKHRELLNRNMDQERYLVRMESLKDSLLYFTQHLKTPVDELLAQAKNLNAGDVAGVERFRTKVIEECAQVLATLDGLSDKVEEYRKNPLSIRRDHSSLLKELDQRFNAHYNKDR
jgi:DNA-binding response OmpR family regulator